MRVITKEQIFDDFAIILELSDAELAFIEEDVNRLKNMHVMAELMKSRGTNAHVVQITLNSEVPIKEYIERLLCLYSSVSWVTRENKFHIRRNCTALLN
jgi:hypothetical protein